MTLIVMSLLRPLRNVAQLRHNFACDWLDIEVDANSGVAWSNPDNDVMQLLDEGVAGRDLFTPSNCVTNNAGSKTKECVGVHQLYSWAGTPADHVWTAAGWSISGCK